MLGLNPHAGEGGHLGREEIDVIEPTLAALRSEGLDLVGPVPADTAFLPHRLKGIDAVLAMYHDQGLPVLKHASFGHAVNVTLGLPIVRTSVDHGTALDLAGTRKADPGSLQAAFALALELSQRAESGRRAGETRPRQEALRAAFPARPRHDRPHRARHRSAPGRAPRRSRPRPRRDHGARARSAPAGSTSSRSTATSCRHCRRTARVRGELHVHLADALEFDFRALRGDGPPLRLIGNLPYNVSTPLLFHFISQLDAIADMHFMLQKEVVVRMAAAPGSGDYGRLTVMLAPHVKVARCSTSAPARSSPRRRSRRRSSR